jgi:hypothetical protein
MVSCVFISLLLVTVGITCSKAGININVVINILILRIFRLMLILLCI